MRNLTAILAFVLAILPGSVGAQKFAPHRALYDMSLRSSERDSNIVSVRGEMLAEWGETCEAWTLEHRSSFEIDVGGEQTVQLSTNIATWEARDGLSYRFNVRNVERDGDEERIEGSATLEGPGKSGTVRYVKPETKIVPLPAGTIFPTAHTEEVLVRAGEEPFSFKRIVFDGLSGDGLFDVSAVVGAPYPPSPVEREAAKPVAAMRAWPIHVAFFRYGSADAAPDNEVSFRGYANGVSDDMIIDFGQFKVLAKLKALELGVRPVCK